MKQVQQRRSFVEKAYVTDDGQSFSYKAQAIEHERQYFLSKLDRLEKITYQNDLLKIQAVFYQLVDEDDIDALNSFLESYGSDRIDTELPCYAGYVIFEHKYYGITRDGLIDKIRTEVEKIR